MGEIAVLILESSQPEGPGDISLYRRISEAESALEAIDIRNNEYFGYALDGRALAFGLEGEIVRIATKGDGIDHAKIVRRLLEDYASTVVARKKTGLVNIPALSLEELVDIVGFSR